MIYNVIISSSTSGSTYINYFVPESTAPVMQLVLKPNYYHKPVRSKTNEKNKART